jgi:hypothetical protein
MPPVLRAKPVNVQVKHRGMFVPPRYDLLKVDISVSIAGKLAETYNLKSTGIIVNQNAASTQYLSFRYFLPGEPFRYFDASIGLDQTEIVFSNPATVGELMGEVAKLWKLVFEGLQPIITSNYLEATLHCETEDSTKAFLNALVNLQSNAPGIEKGFSLTAKTLDVDAVARISLEASDSIPDGLYVMFAFVSKGTVRDMASFKNLFDATLNTYRELQSSAQIELVEPI